MKLDYNTFKNILTAPHYEGFEGYLIDDNKEKIPYQIYLGLIESETLAAIFVKKLNDENAVMQIFEFNGNKLLDHHVVRVKELDSKNPKFKRLMTQFENKEFIFE